MPCQFFLSTLLRMRVRKQAWGMTDKSQLSFLCKLRIFELYFIQDNTLSKGNQIHMEKQVTFSGNEAF